MYGLLSILVFYILYIELGKELNSILHIGEHLDLTLGLLIHKIVSSFHLLQPLTSNDNTWNSPRNKHTLPSTIKILTFGHCYYSVLSSLIYI